MTGLGGSSQGGGAVPSPPAELVFDDNRALPLLYGAQNSNLERIERRLGVLMAARGNRLSIGGNATAVETARRALTALYDRVKRGLDIDAGEIDGAIRLAEANEPGDGPSFRTRRRQVSPRTPTQAAYVRALLDHELVFGLGPAGTGKTYLAVAAAVDFLTRGQVERIILSRPAVEAGERLGFLPGDLKDKVDPYLRPLYDALYDMLPADQVSRRLEAGEIEIAPLAFMRGRTLSHAFVILDEAQNTTEMQMKMFLTRLGEGSRMVVTGDLTQVDLPRGVSSGLAQALKLLEAVEGVGTVRFRDTDVVRHPLVARIVRAYEHAAAQNSPYPDQFANSGGQAL